MIICWTNKQSQTSQTPRKPKQTSDILFHLLANFAKLSSFFQKQKIPRTTSVKSSDQWPGLLPQLRPSEKSNKKIYYGYKCRPVNLCCHRHDSVPHAFYSTPKLKPDASAHLQHFLVSRYWSTRQENRFTSQVILTLLLSKTRLLSLSFFFLFLLFGLLRKISKTEGGIGAKKKKREKIKVSVFHQLLF